MLKQNWIWKLYLLVHTGFMILKGFMFFVPGQRVHTYYAILVSFGFPFLPNYLFAVICQILTLIHLYPLYRFVMGKTTRHPRTWQLLFLLRIVFDICGNSYYLQFIKSTYYLHPNVTYIVIFQICALYIPSYIGCFIYAFRQK